MTMPLTDDQIVLALIASYKSRGIDMSAMLDDPLFDKLPAAVKIKAVKDHAGTLSQGTASGYRKVDYTRIGANALLSMPQGALTGAGIGAALATPGKYGVNSMHGALVGALLTGAAGAISGYMASSEEANRREAIKNALEVAAKDRSVETAVSALTTSHANASSATLRKNILDRISGIVGMNAERSIGPVLSAQHSYLTSLNTEV